eukprot:364943-Chlamydomonas_euryale.AAC.23
MQQAWVSLAGPLQLHGRQSAGRRTARATRHNRPRQRTETDQQGNANGNRNAAALRLRSPGQRRPLNAECKLRVSRGTFFCPWPALTSRQRVKMRWLSLASFQKKPWRCCA